MKRNSQKEIPKLEYCTEKFRLEVERLSNGSKAEASKRVRLGLDEFGRMHRLPIDRTGLMHTKIVKQIAGCQSKHMPSF